MRINDIAAIGMIGIIAWIVYKNWNRKGNVSVESVSDSTAAPSPFPPVIAPPISLPITTISKADVIGAPTINDDLFQMPKLYT